MILSKSIESALQCLIFSKSVSREVSSFAILDERGERLLGRDAFRLLFGLDAILDFSCELFGPFEVSGL